MLHFYVTLLEYPCCIRLLKLKKIQQVYTEDILQSQDKYCDS